jgi:hypothetical protein
MSRASYLWFASAVLAASVCQAVPPPAGHPILGTWQLVLPVSKCVETYEYRADGTSHSVSAAEETDSAYEISAKPSDKGYYVLTDTITKSNAKPDCSGQITPTDKPVTLYLAPLRGGFLLCFDPALQRCLGPMMRVAAPPGAAAR